MSDTLLRIRLFAAVYEERSFTAAAVRENATQSGVTQHVRKLEEQLKVTLFLRGTTNVRPTPAGDTYYLSCIQVLRAHDQARQSLREYSGSLDGEVRVGLTPTMTRAVLAPALARFMASAPNVSVRIVDAYGDIIMEKVSSGELDFAIVPGTKHQTGIKSTPFARTPEFLVSGPRSGLDLTPMQTVELNKLGPLKIVVPSTSQLRRNSLESYFSSVGASIARRLEIDSSFGADDFVASTDWVTIHPAITMLREIERGHLIINPLVAPSLTLDLYRIRTRPAHAVACNAGFD